MAFLIVIYYVLNTKLESSVEVVVFQQAELFENFLHGSTLKECYSEVAFVANRWLDLLDVC
jgi:DNA polymerase epsilon subunit 1